MNKSHNVIESTKNPKRKLTGEAAILSNGGTTTTLSVKKPPKFFSFNRALEIPQEGTQARSCRTNPFPQNAPTEEEEEENVSEEKNPRIGEKGAMDRRG